MHPSQEAAARSLGLTRGQALASVVLPQAVRRVIPPLLNDFIGLQKDTALVGILGSVEAFKQSQIDVSATSTSPTTSSPRRSSSRSRSRSRASPTGSSPATGAGGRRGAWHEREAARIEGVRKSFGTDEVLRGIDLDVAEHEVVCLIGASGSGKSTLLRCVNLLEPIDARPHRGRGRGDHRARRRREQVRRRIGIVFQAYNLFPHMSVLENVTLAPRKALGASASRGRRRGDRAAGPLRARRQARRLPGPALGRPAAAGRDRAGACDASRT